MGRFLVMVMVVLLGIGRASAQPDTAIAHTLLQWSTNVQGISAERPYVLFLISVADCVGCGVTAVNRAMKGVEEEALPVNVIVVVAAQAPREGLALKKMFMTSSVVEDSPARLKEIFGFEGNTPGMVVVRGGRVVHRQEDIQHDPVDMEGLRRASTSDSNEVDGSSIVVDRPAIGVQLQEDDDLVLTAHSPKVDSRNRMVTFFDGAQNDLFRFGLDRGERVGRLVVPGEIGLHFHDAMDTNGVWSTLIENYNPLARVDDIIRSSLDTLEVMARMFTGYDLIQLPNGRQQARLTAAMIVLTLRVTADSMELLSLQPMPQSSYVSVTSPSSSMQQLEPLFYVGCVVPERALADTTWERTHADSLFTLMAFCGDSLRATPILVLHEEERRFGMASDIRYEKHIASAGGWLYYFDVGNGAFLRGQPTCVSLEYEPIELGGVTTAMYNHRYSLKKGPVRIDSAMVGQLTVDGIMTNGGDVAHVVLSGVDTTQRRNWVVVQEYRHGGYTGETIYRYTIGDRFVKVIPAGYDGREIVVLVKWETARWTIERFPW